MATPIVRRSVLRITMPAAAGAVGAALGAAVAAFGLAPLAALGGLILSYLLFVSPQLGVLVMLLVRPLLDLAPSGLSLPGFAKELDISAAVSLILAGGGAFYVLVNRIQILRLPLVVPFLALLVVGSASLVASGDPGLTLIALARLSGQLAVFVLVYHGIRERSQVNRLVAVLIASAVPPVVWGFGQILAGHGTYLRPGIAEGITHPRLSGPFGAGLTVGTFLVIPLVILTVLVIEGWRGWGRLLCGGLLAFLGVAFYFTLARAAWAAFALSLLVLGLVRYRRLLLAGPLALLIIIMLAPGIRQRWTPVLESPEDTTMAGRFERWQGAWQVFLDHPILGAGLGVGDVEAGAEAAGRASPAHSDYLRVLADTGVLGLGAYLWLLAAAGIEGMRAYRRVHTSLFQGLALAFLAVWAAFMVIRVSGNVLTHQVFQYYFWALAAGALALPRVEAAEQGNP